MPAPKETAGTGQTISTEIPKIQTHIDGLDGILHGGIPSGRTTLISGGPARVKA